MTTHTYSILEISPAAFREIRERIIEADYGHLIMPGGEVDMQGIALAPIAEGTTLTTPEGKTLSADEVNKIAIAGRATTVSRVTEKEPEDAIDAGEK